MIEIHFPAFATYIFRIFDFRYTVVHFNHSVRVTDDGYSLPENIKLKCCVSLNKFPWFVKNFWNRDSVDNGGPYIRNSPASLLRLNYLNMVFHSCLIADTDILHPSNFSKV